MLFDEKLIFVVLKVSFDVGLPREMNVSMETFGQ